MSACACPNCGHRFEPFAFADLIDEWLDYCQRRGHRVTASSTVAEAVAAELLGVAPRVLARKRRSGGGPQALHLPVDGSRWSYELHALAEWRRAHKEGEAW